MRWEDERYVRVYVRDTPEFCVLPWEARALFVFLLRRVDRAGLVDLGRSGVRGLAGMVSMPLEVVEKALPELLADGCVQQVGTTLVIPNFVSAQETAQSDKLRARESRGRARDRVLGAKAVEAEHRQTVTNRDGASRIVTERHAPSHGVTPSHTASLCAVLFRTSPPNPPLGGEGWGGAQTCPAGTRLPASAQRPGMAPRCLVAPPDGGAATLGHRAPDAGTARASRGTGGAEAGAVPRLPSEERPAALDDFAIANALHRGSKGAVLTGGTADMLATLRRLLAELGCTLADVEALGRYCRERPPGFPEWAAHHKKLGLAQLLVSKRGEGSGLTELVEGAREWANAQAAKPTPPPGPKGPRAVPGAARTEAERAEAAKLFAEGGSATKARAAFAAPQAKAVGE